MCKDGEERFMLVGGGGDLGVLRSWEEPYGVGERKLEEVKAGGQGWVSGPWPGGWAGFVLRESGSCWRVLSRKRT